MVGFVVVDVCVSVPICLFAVAPVAPVTALEVVVVVAPPELEVVVFGGPPTEPGMPELLLIVMLPIKAPPTETPPF